MNLDGDPLEYLPKIDAEQLRKQFVPTDSSLYTVDNYELFLKKKKKLTDGINSFLKSFMQIPLKEQSIKIFNTMTKR